MSNDEILENYKYACQQKRFPPNEGEFKGWKTKFPFFDSQDLRAAIDEWYRTSNLMPMPLDLAPLIQRSQQSRAMETSIPRAMVVWQCPCCNHQMVGFLSSTESAFRKCPSFYGPAGTILSLGTKCGAEMNIFRDERRQAHWDYGDRKAMAANG